MKTNFFRMMRTKEGLAFDIADLQLVMAWAQTQPNCRVSIAVDHLLTEEAIEIFVPGRVPPRWVLWRDAKGRLHVDDWQNHEFDLPYQTLSEALTIIGLRLPFTGNLIRTFKGNSIMPMMYYTPKANSVGHFDHTYEEIAYILCCVITSGTGLVTVIMSILAIRDYQRGRFHRGVALTYGQLQSVFLIMLISAMMANIGWIITAIFLFGFITFNFFLYRVRYWYRGDC